jgi:hypothetical protein
MKTVKNKILVMFLCIMMATTTVSTVEPVTIQAKTTYVYITKSGRGKKYHAYKNCRTLRRSKVGKIKLKSAKKQGLTKCKVCY